MKTFIINWCIAKIRKNLVKMVKKTDNKVDDALVVLFDQFVREWKRKHQ